MLIHEMSLRDVMFGVWCAMSATRVIGSGFFCKTTNLQTHIAYILKLFLITGSTARTYTCNSFFQQETATCHNTNNSMRSLESVFGHRILRRGLRPPRLTYLSLCDG
jgi:hypothetical protein